VLYGGKNQLATVLRYIPAGERARWPRILIADAYLKLKDGELAAARASLDLAPSLNRISGLDWAEMDDVSHDTLNIGTMLDIYEDKVDLASIERNERLRGRVPATEGLTRGVLGCQQAVAALGVGRLAYAETLARNAMSCMRTANSVLGDNYCYLHAGLSAMLRGRMRDANSYLSQAREMAEQNFGEDSGLKSLSDILWGTQHFWCSGDTGMTDGAFERAFTHVRNYDGWFEIYAAGLDTRFRLALARDDRARMEQVIEDGLDLCRERRIARLDLLVRGHRLMLALARGGRSEARQIVHSIAQDLPLGRWKAQPELWRPVLDCGLPMLRFHQEGDRHQALLIADDLIECAESMGAELYRIRALIARAGLLERMDRRDAARADLSAAALSAMAEMIRQPFLESPSLAGALRSLRRDLRQQGEEPGLDHFLALLPGPAGGTASTSETEGMASMAAVLSPREMDVMRQLRRGSTNKEIARVLDMTEHTVKFHLRNIFAKLGVDRRAHAAVMMHPVRGPSSAAEA
jgi:LuxR family maltose regulon positive regulatory protein